MSSLSGNKIDLGEAFHPGWAPTMDTSRTEYFYAALIGQGTAEEAAALLWECARKHEPWAVQALLQRLAPETKQIRLTHGVDDEPTVDYTRLRNEELEQLDRLLERASIPAGTSENGDGPVQSEAFMMQAWPVLEPGTEFVEGMHIERSVCICRR
jgi:hypothetical protein